VSDGEKREQGTHGCPVIRSTTPRPDCRAGTYLSSLSLLPRTIDVIEAGSSRKEGKEEMIMI